MALRGRHLGGALAVAAVGLLTVAYPLHGDVRHEVGVQAVSGHPAAATFSHRPLLFRLLTAALARDADLVTSSVRGFEVAMRLGAVVLAAGAAALLWRGLRRYRSTARAAAPVGGVVLAALVLMSPSAVLQPDWWAVVLAVAGVGAALGGRHDRVAGVAAGILLAAAAAVKVVTLPVAVLGLLAIVLLDRRRALLAGVSTVVAGLGYLLLVVHLAPWEFRWMLDIGLLQPEPRPAGAQLALVGEYLANAVVCWPVIALVPAALVGVPLRLRLAVGAALLLAWSPVPLQDQFFPYQSPALPVVAAVVVLLALLRAGPSPVPLVVLAATASWTACVLATGVPLLSERLPLWLAAVGALGVAAWAGRHRAVRRERRAGRDRPAAPRRTRLAAAAALALTFVATATPVAAQSVSLRGTQAMNPRERTVATAEKQAAADRLRTVIGPDTPVTYLAFGETIYFLRNPTSCRFPSPVFLQRSRYQHGHEGSASWTETLTCIQDAPGDWLVWETAWFKRSGQPPEVTAVLEATFDCDRSVELDPVVACPRRTTDATGAQPTR